MTLSFLWLFLRSVIMTKKRLKKDLSTPKFDYLAYGL